MITPVFQADHDLIMPKLLALADAAIRAGNFNEANSAIGSAIALALNTNAHGQPEPKAKARGIAGVDGE